MAERGILRGITLARPWPALFTLDDPELQRPRVIVCSAPPSEDWTFDEAGVALPPRPLFLALHAGEEVAAPELASLRFEGYTHLELGRPDEIVAVGQVERVLDYRALDATARDLLAAEPLFALLCLGRYVWRLVDVVRLPEPVPCPGGDGLVWGVPTNVIGMVRKRWAAARR